MLDWLKKKKQATAAIFVDYEHWYYGYQNKFSMKPNVEEWFQEIKGEYDVKYIKFFGNFTGYGLDNELVRLKKMGNNVVHTASDKDGVDKDFTDFIILDEIYRKAAEKDCPDAFILFTGDAHFDLAVKYLRSLNKKVIIYGVKYSFSNRLKSSANSYVEMPRSKQEKQYYYEAIFTSLKQLRKRKKQATYRKTIINVAEHSGVSQDRIQNALDELLNQKYLYETEAEYRGRKIKLLQVDWNRVEQKGWV